MEHPKVLTLGRNSSAENILLDESALRERGFETFDVGRVRVLHSWHLATTFRRPFDVGIDSNELLEIRGLTTDKREPLKVVLNWDAELEGKNR